jgi:hypothetical protein
MRFWFACNFKWLWLVILFSSGVSPVWSATYYWVAPVGAQAWNDPQNWSSTSGGAGGVGVPSATDDVIFDKNGVGDVFVDIPDLVVGSLLFETDFIGLIDLGSDTLRTNSITNFQTPMQNGVVRVLGGRIQIQNSDLAIALIGLTDDLNLLSNTIQNVTLTTTGTGLNSVTGNTFTAATSFTRAGTGTLYFDSNSYQDVTIRNQNNAGEVTCQGTETYVSNTTMINDATSPMRLAHAGGLTSYLGIVRFSNLQNGTISVGLGGGLATLEASGSIGIIDTTIGTVSLNNFTINGTFNPTSLVLTGTTHLHLANCTFNSLFSQTLPRITCGTGNQFNNEFFVEVTGDQPSSISGTFSVNFFFANIVRSGTGVLTLESNSFLRYLALTNSNNSGSIICKGNEVYSSLDVFNYADSPVDLAYSDGSTSFRGNIRFINTQNGTISTGIAGGLAVLETTATFEIGQFGTGTVSLNNLTVNGTFNPASVVLTGTTHLHLANCTFNSLFSQTLPRITCGTGNQFNNEFFVEVTGDQPSSISGTFSVNFFFANIVRSGTGVLTLESNSFLRYLALTNSNNSGSIICKGNEVYSSLDVFNYADSPVDLAYSDGSTSFRGNIRFINTQNGTISTGIAGGLAVLETTATFEIGQFGTGTVSLNNLTVNGQYNPLLAPLTGTTHLHLANCTFNSGFSQVIPRITCGTGNQFNQRFNVSLTGTPASAVSGTFARRADIIHTGDGNVSVFSGNFLDSAFFQNDSPIGSLQLTDNTFNTVVTFTRTNGTLQPCASGTCIFRNNITLNSGTSGSDFVIGTPTQGIIRLEGGIDQNVNGTGTANIIIHLLELNKSAGVVKINRPLSIGTSLTFGQGLVRTSDANFIRFLDGATTSGASALSYIEGPARKLGNDTFTFPIGDGGTLRPISISAPASVTDEFTARFFRTAQPFGGTNTYIAPLLTVSTCEYWTLNRTAGTASVFVTLGWQTADCPAPYITDPTTLHVARWNGTQWVSHGQGSFTGTSAAGSVTSAGAVSSFSPFALGSTSPSNPLPIRLLDFAVVASGNKVELQWHTASEINSDYFGIQRSQTGIEFETIAQVPAAQYSQVTLRYRYVDQQPLTGESYYRLKMIDQDGTIEYSKVVSITLDEKPFQVFPNPTSETLFFTKKRYVKLLSLLGVVIFQSEAPVEKILLPTHLVAGTYLLQTDQGEVFKISIVR